VASPRWPRLAPRLVSVAARLSSDRLIDRLIAVVLFTEGQEPELFLIPMTVWNTPDAVFVDHDYVEGKSKPE
jgi:hypothetical protein